MSYFDKLGEGIRYGCSQGIQGKDDKIVKADTFEEAKALFEEVLNNISKEHSYFAKKLKKDADRYLISPQFLREIKSRIKSTSASENLHKEKLS